VTLDEINQQLDQTDKTINSLNNLGVTESMSSDTPTWWSVTNAMTISSVVLLFGLLVILLATYLIRSGINTEAVLRIFGTILIIMVSVFLVVAGYTDTQIAPVMGLLGTIVGYLLGKETKEVKD
jgi:hypothetical protein